MTIMWPSHVRPQILALLLALILLSCSDSTGPDQNFGKVSAYIDVTQLTHKMKDSSVTVGTMFANFHDIDADKDVLVNGVSINGTQLQRRRPSDTNYTFQSLDGTLPVAFDGSVQQVQIDGGSVYPSTTLTMTSPSRPVVITYPTVTDEVSKSAGFVVRWEKSSNDSDIVFVTMGDSTGRVFINTTVPDTGEFIPTADPLKTAVPGRLLVQVARIRSTVKLPFSEPGYTLMVSSIVQVETVMKP